MRTRQPRKMPMQRGPQQPVPVRWPTGRRCVWLIWLLVACLPRGLAAQSPAAPPGSSPAAPPAATPAEPTAADAPSEPPADQPPDTQLPETQPPNTEQQPSIPASSQPAVEPPAAPPFPPAQPAAPSSPASPAAPPAVPANVPSPPATAPASGLGNTNQPAADGTVSVVIAPAETPAFPPAAVAPPTAASLPTSQTAVSPPPDQPEKSAATQLLEQILEPLENQPSPSGNSIDRSLLYARPLPLLEALQRSGDRSRRLWITQAYWQVSAGYAAIRFATEAVEQLQLVAPGGDPHDQAVLDVAIAAAEADLAAAHAELIAAQQQLADLVRLPIGEPPPWPVDRPLAGAYQTHFAAIFATRPATGRIRAIDRSLPSKHAAVEARATALLAAQAAMLRAEADHAQGKRPIEAVIAAHQMLQQQQHGFIDSLAAYNLDIAEYAMAVADISVPDDRYVSMLIGTPIQWTPQPAMGVLPAGGLQPVDPQATLPRQ